MVVSGFLRNRRRCFVCKWMVTLAVVVAGLSIHGALMAECPETVIDVLIGEPIPMEMMMEDLASVRIVYIGELHTLARHHRVQTEILRKLASMNPKLALGMEMFSIEQQPILDKWQRGTDGLDHLMKDLGGKYWTNLHDYASLLLLARDRKIPIVALNAEDDLVKQVARHGLANLTAKQREHVPPDVSDVNPSHDRLLRTRLKVHKAFKEKVLDNIVLAQALRDATMAHALTRFLNSEEGKDRIMVVVAGAGHMSYGFGIPERAEKLTKLPYRIVLPTESGELVLSEEEKRQSQPVPMTHEDLKFLRTPIADYLQLIPLKAPESPDDELPTSPQHSTTLGSVTK